MTDLEPPNETLKARRLAGCLIFDEQGRILLAHRKTDKQNQWETLGGGVGDGESSADAAKREAMEEAGIEVMTQGLAITLSFIEDDVPYDYDLYHAVITSGKPTPYKEKRFVEFRYWSWDDLNHTSEPLSFNVGNLLEAQSSGRLSLPEQSS